MLDDCRSNITVVDGQEFNTHLQKEYAKLTKRVAKNDHKGRAKVMEPIYKELAEMRAQGMDQEFKIKSSKSLMRAAVNQLSAVVCTYTPIWFLR